MSGKHFRFCVHFLLVRARNAHNYHKSILNPEEESDVRVLIRQVLNSGIRNAALDEIQFTGGPIREVNFSSGMRLKRSYYPTFTIHFIGPSIGNLNNYTLVVGEVGNPETASHRPGTMGGGKIKHIIYPAGGGGSTVEPTSIPGNLAIIALFDPIPGQQETYHEGNEDQQEKGDQIGSIREGNLHGDVKSSLSFCGGNQIPY